MNTREITEIARHLDLHYHGTAVKVAIQDGHDLAVIEHMIVERHSAIETHDKWADWNAIDVALDCGRLDVLAWLVDQRKVPIESQAMLLNAAIRHNHFHIVKWMMQRPSTVISWDELIRIIVSFEALDKVLGFFKLCAEEVLRSASLEKLLMWGQKNILFANDQPAKQTYQSILKSLEQYLVEGDEAIATLISKFSALTFDENANNKAYYTESVIIEAQTIFDEHKQSAVMFAVNNKKSVELIQYLFAIFHCPLLGQEMDVVKSALDSLRLDVLSWLIDIGFDRNRIDTEVLRLLDYQPLSDIDFNLFANFLRQSDRKNDLLVILNNKIKVDPLLKDISKVLISEMLLVGEIEIKELYSPLVTRWPESHIMHRAMQAYYLVKDCQHPTAQPLRSAFINIIAGNTHCSPLHYASSVQAWSHETAQLFVCYSLFKDYPDDLHMHEILRLSIGSKDFPVLLKPEEDLSLKRKRSDSPDPASKVDSEVASESAKERRSKRTRIANKRYELDSYPPSFFAAKPESTIASLSPSLKNKLGQPR